MKILKSWTGSRELHNYEAVLSSSEGKELLIQYFVEGEQGE